MIELVFDTSRAVTNAIDRSFSPLPRFTLVTALTAALWLPLCAAAPTDFFPQRVARPAPPAGRVLPQHSFYFGEPVRGRRVLHWQYNNAGVPGQLGLDDAGIVQLFAGAAAKWTAVCGVTIVYDGPTSSSPAMAEPDRVNVVGWRPPEGGVQAATSLWYGTAPNGEEIIDDADILLDPALVTTPELVATLMAHEWGHAIGLGHSPVTRALMSGPPVSAYSNLSDLTPDDVQGCRCLYGLPANVQEGYICSLPSKIDFGTVTVGTSSAPHPVNVTNDGTAPMTIGSLQLQGGGFAFATNNCTTHTTLSPGASCSISIAGTPATADVQRAEAIINTSGGPYRVPLSVTGTPPPPPPPPPLNFEGAWWNAPAGSEDGWGLTLAHQDDVIFATWFTYGADGKAMWLSMTAFRTGNNTFSGRLFRSTGPPLARNLFDPGAVLRFDVGTATLSFSDAAHGTFAYTINGSSRIKSLVRFTFGPLPTCTFAGSDNPTRDNKFQGNWWTASGTESGWGLYLAHQGDVIFVGWFIYDEDGTPMWLSATASRTSDVVYRGDVMRSTGPPLDAAPFDSQGVSRSTIGTMTLTFPAPNMASFEYSVRIGDPPSMVSRSKLLEPLIFRPPGTRCEQ